MCKPCVQRGSGSLFVRASGVRVHAGSLRVPELRGNEVACIRPMYTQAPSDTSEPRHRTGKQEIERNAIDGVGTRRTFSHDFCNSRMK